MKFVTAILFLMTSAVCMNGQSVRDTIQLGEVRIYGQRIAEEMALHVTRPDSMAFAATFTSNLSELLTLYTPVFIKSYGNGSAATASFRGTSASHTQIVWNGLNLNSPMRGYADLSLLPVLFTDEAWLLHGGSSLSEGSGSLGGSIHLGNKADWNRKNTILLAAERASFETGRYLFKGQAGVGNFRAVTRGMVEHSANNYPFYNVGVLPYRKDTLKNGGYVKWALLQELYYRPVYHTLVTGRIWYQEGDRNLPQLMSYEGGGREERQKDEQFRAMLEAEQFRDNLKLQYFGGLNQSRLLYLRRTLNPAYVNDDAVSKENSLFNRLRMNATVGSRWIFHGSAELNYHWVNVYNQPRNEGYNETRLESGIMAHVIFQPARSIGLYGLLRTEWYDGRHIPLIPSAGLEISFAGSIPLIIKTNVSRNFHKPTLNDLYWIPGGNPGLLPEDGLTADMVISAESETPGLWKQQISLFLSSVNNWILWQPASNGAWYWEAANVRDVLSRGIEYQFSSDMPVGKVNLKASGNYAFTRTTNQNAVSSVDKSRGKQLIYIPKHNGNIHLSAALTKWTLKGILSYTGRRYTQSSNEWSHFENVLNPFLLAGTTLERKFMANETDLLVRIGIENLFNANYQQILWRPMPGRHYSLTLVLNRKR